jgi:hypothetical protein
LNQVFPPQFRQAQIERFSRDAHSLRKLRLGHPQFNPA